jgi:serine/threonine protein kinase
MMDIENRISTVDAINIGISLLKIIEKVHDKGYCHTDIKPDNILIKSCGNIDNLRKVGLNNIGNIDKT